jgi:hypothetical protein
MPIPRILWFAAFALACAGVMAAARSAPGQKKDKAGYTDTPMLPGGKWHVHDPDRPDPPFIEPGSGSPPETPGKPPSDAVVLFDGRSLEQWETPDGKTPGWIVRDGYAMVPAEGAPNGGDMRTKESFGDCQLHVEWALPARTPGDEHSMNRGNSGVFMLGQYEVQIFDSWRTAYIYADGQAAAIYGQFPPMVNACRAPGEWQSFDILFTAPRLRDGKLESPAYITVFHNGICVHDHQALLGPTGHRILPQYGPDTLEKGPVMLQAHGSPVRFRNLWVRNLKTGD